MRDVCSELRGTCALSFVGVTSSFEDLSYGKSKFWGSCFRFLFEGWIGGFHHFRLILYCKTFLVFLTLYICSDYSGFDLDSEISTLVIGF